MENYESAARRHFQDALALEASGSVDNAGHLIGFAAECAIKFRIMSLRPGESSPHGHFPDILIAARKHLGARMGYTSMFAILKMDIFKGWAIDRRYAATGHTNSVELAQWIETTKRLFAAAGLKVRQ